MTLLDWAIIAIIAVSGFISIIRGFVKEAISLITWILAFWIALTFSDKLAYLLQGLIASATLRWIAAAVILFMVTLLVGGLTNFLVSTLVEKTGLSGTDRALGVVFGVLRGVLMVALLVLVVGQTAVASNDWWRQSSLRPTFASMAGWMRAHYPAGMAASVVADDEESVP